MTTQVKTTPISISSIVGAKAFRVGVEEYLAGRAPNFDDPENFKRGSSWYYERGRLYAAAHAGAGLAVPPLRLARAVNRLAIRRYSELQLR